MAESVQNQIENRISSQKRGTIFFPSDFSALANVESVKKTLLRLEKRNFLVRLAHGIYLYPKRDKTLGMLYPSVDEIAQVIAKRDKARIIPTGVQALNKLGLSAQVPMKVVYLTDGSPRSIQVGRRSIKFKKTTPKNLSVKGEISGLVIQALREIGKDNATIEQINKITDLLKKENPKLAKYDALLAPAWIREIMLNPIKSAMPK
jgi:hypothetical protein